LFGIFEFGDATVEPPYRYYSGVSVTDEMEWDRIGIEGFLPMKCEDLLQAMNDYVDGNVDPGICEQFEQHLAGCNPCQVVVDNIRKTITLYKAGQPYEMPAEFQQKLRAAIREKWKAAFSKQP
jgi:hypothetical protein